MRLPFLGSHREAVAVRPGHPSSILDARPVERQQSQRRKDSGCRVQHGGGYLKVWLKLGACLGLAILVLPLIQPIPTALAACGEDVKLEADYILSAQYLKQGDRASGAINNVFGAPTWVVPRENAMAIIGLARASDCLGSSLYLSRAQQALDYLVRMQQADGSWYDQYSYASPAVLSKSPTQTAEVMLAMNRLGYARSRYPSMVSAAEFLLTLQDPARKGGVDDGLVAGGKDAQGNYQGWRWTSDNAYSYQALKTAERWANLRGDRQKATRYAVAGSRLLNGINTVLKDPSSPVWYAGVDEADAPLIAAHEWINYAPQMLDVPAAGVGPSVGTWIRQALVDVSGGALWNDGSQKNRLSPGFSFQACLVWKDAGQQSYCDAALSWANGSGLHQLTADANGVKGGWVDWVETNGNRAPYWQRFVDTSAYAILVATGGYNFAP